MVDTFYEPKHLKRWSHPDNYLSVSYDQGVARYTLNSFPNAQYPDTLPEGYEGMRSGGNELAKVVVEV